MKIELHLTTEDQSKPLTKNVLYADALKQRGITFVQDGGDVILCHASLLTSDILNGTKPVYILERIDATTIIKREALKHDNVRAVIKNTTLSPKDLNNHKICYGRYHNKLIMDSVKTGCPMQSFDTSYYSEVINPESNSSPYRFMPLDSKIILDESDLKKIRLGYSFCHYEKMNDLCDLPWDDSDRKNDLHFIGTIEYGQNVLATMHRKLALETCRSLRGCTTILDAGRTKSKRDYLKELLDSKIVLSPWGHGEACYRDYEAMFCGCILLKPDSSFVDTWPNIFQNNITYIPCKVDFSDLQEKVDWIRSNWDKLYDMRRNNIETLRNARTPEAFANHMVNIFTNGN